MSSSLRSSRSSSSRCELALQRPIGHPPSLLEQLDDLVEHRIKVHHRPSTCASAASAWGSQKVMSMARYSSMAVDSSARACSRWPSLGIQGAEAAVAVGLERAHAEFLGQGEGLAVVGFGLLDLRGLALRRNLAEEAQGIRLVATFLVLTGERQRPLGEGVRLLQAASQQLRLPQGETTERLKAYHFRCQWSVPSPA